MAINFPSNPSNEQQVTLAGTTYTYNSAKTKWEIRNLFTSSVFDSAEVVSIVDSSYVSSRQEAAGVTVYANRSSLPASGNTAGDQAYVTANNRLYIWNGTGWYNIALLNLAPSIQSVLDSDNNTTPFALAIDGSPTTITVTAVDSDGDPITYGYSADSNFSGLATLSQANNVFTITPFSEDSATTTSGTITFTATDDVNVASSGVQTFTLSFSSTFTDDATTNKSSSYYAIERSSYNSGGQRWDMAGGDNIGQDHSYQLPVGEVFPSSGTFKVVVQKTADYPSDNQQLLIISTRSTPWAKAASGGIDATEWETEDEITLGVQVVGSSYTPIMIYNLGGNSSNVSSTYSGYTFDDETSYHTFELVYSSSGYSLVVDGSTKASVTFPSSVDTSGFKSATVNFFQLSGRRKEFSIT